MNKDYLTLHYTFLGKTVRQIAREVGLSHSTVVKAMRKHGVSARQRRVPSKRIYVKCEHCSKQIERVPSTLNPRNFCSMDCRNAWMVGNTAGELSCNWKGGITAISSANLKTPQFRALKKIVLEKFPLCVLCGNNKRLHVHHIHTRREHPDMCFELNNLITLCVSCHSSIKGREAQYADHFMRLVCKGGELRENLNSNEHGNPQPTRSNVLCFVGRKVQRLTGEEVQTDKPDTSAAPERDEIVRTYAKA